MNREVEEEEMVVFHDYHLEVVALRRLDTHLKPLPRMRS